MSRSAEDDGRLLIRYRFEFEDGHTAEHDVSLDQRTIELVEQPPDNPPEWTRLPHQQCPNCPLHAAEHPNCPAAIAVANLSTHFGHRDSYTPVTVVVETAHRTVSSRVGLQSGLFSLLGLRMATSGCPVLGKLRPMARFHLPFASWEETAYRALAMYLVGQFLRRSQGLSTDYSLDELRRIYQEVHLVNLAFSRRLGDADSADANLNSLITLDMLAQGVPFSIDTDLARLQDVFSPYLG